jgi:hypothetical protein
MKSNIHIFIHLHKTGGTTMMNLLDVIYKDKSVYTIDGKRYRESLNEMLKLERKDFDLIKGHQFFGTHTSTQRQAIYFSMVREPVSRVVSLYNYLKTIDLYPEINNHKMSIIDFMDSRLSLSADNGMTRFLAGADIDQVPCGHCTRQTLNMALSNVDKHFVAVGLSEKFDESLLLYQKLLGWKRYPYYLNRNITRKNFLSIENIDQNELSKLYDRLYCDVILYNVIATRFKKRLYEVFGGSLKKRLKIFKAKNIVFKYSEALKGRFLLE